MISKPKSSTKPTRGVPAADFERWKVELCDETPSAEAWRELLLRLRLGAVQFTDDGNPNLPSGLEPVMFVVGEVAAFLGQHDIIRREQLIDPLGRLIHALVDIGHRRKSPLLTPISAGQGGREASASKHNMQAIAARALSDLLLIKTEPAVAARRVAAAVRAGKIPGYLECTAKNVESWLGRVQRAERGTAKVSANLMERWGATLSPPMSQNPRERAAFLLQALRAGRGLRW